MNLYRWLNQRHSEKTWAKIDKRVDAINDGTAKLYSWDDMQARRLLAELEPWWKKYPRKLYKFVYYFLFGFNGLFSRILNPRHIVNQFVWGRQRSKRGWCDSDCWSIDGYITRVLSGMLAYLAEHNCAYPGQEPFDTPEKWHAHLVDLSTRMRAWNDDSFCDTEAYETTRQAMREFAENLGRYWD